MSGSAQLSLAQRGGPNGIRTPRHGVQSAFRDFADESRHERTRDTPPLHLQRPMRLVPSTAPSIPDTARSLRTALCTDNDVLDPPPVDNDLPPQQPNSRRNKVSFPPCSAETTETVPSPGPLGWCADSSFLLTRHSLGMLFFPLPSTFHPLSSCITGHPKGEAH